MSTDTVKYIPRPINPSKCVTVKERLAYLRRCRALGWTQNEAARQIGKEPSLFSRWLRGLLASAPMRLALDARLAEAEAAALAEKQSLSAMVRLLVERAPEASA